MDYLIGDVQGCCDALDRLLATIGFSPSRDRIYLLGDLVNRGPASLETLRRLRGFGDAAVCLLGNHDLNLLAVAQGVRRPHPTDTIAEILDAPDRDAWLDWLRQRRMAVSAQGWLMVHAGVVPQWDAAQTLALAGEVEALLRGDGLRDFLPQMYGDQPVRWSDTLAGVERLRFVINVLTRTRFVAADGTLDLVTKDGADGAPPGFYPWFEAPGRRTAGTPIACGHWASLGLVDRPDLLALDTGCVWGRQLSAARIDGRRREIVQVECG
ncbi:symmetrical bis(5'-nucleosyl)-tetraphosphatase [Rhizobacter sp. Root404]|uniref:symmetrical bis(5'-nucleosyl)-tetraphosphatase n=1 Tax=Rhizobacter sp. Root404 TaxID=1736528 RepID=UPI000700BF1C|nr:symmetrical bis(5'-nucleosyl)-tetraphosphatase [Rhizobacter sp. Root404]KQW40612.1 bis(5'-nucleosyl)-tetraphosphatase (symmetrical) [Rhizobacter sp. Root404]